MLTLVSVFENKSSLKINRSWRARVAEMFLFSGYSSSPQPLQMSFAYPYLLAKFLRIKWPARTPIRVLVGFLFGCNTDHYIQKALPFVGRVKAAIYSNLIFRVECETLLDSDKRKYWSRTACIFISCHT